MKKSKKVSKKMNVKWTEPTVNDLESIRNYIVRDSEIYETSFIEKILNAVDTKESDDR